MIPELRHQVSTVTHPVPSDDRRTIEYPGKCPECGAPCLCAWNYSNVAPRAEIRQGCPHLKGLDSNANFLNFDVSDAGLKLWERENARVARLRGMAGAIKTKHFGTKEKEAEWARKAVANGKRA